ncbi:hypothetical protein QCM80_22995 [Bradyrhizobium sp. SSUT112]|uniref:hypothetical protein n=1 Tax=Bradyrhizobium sp. SSUT112 TaxID=3040604 RepID=UPI002449764C|nr:hypothetical protein [Bradyrhizobium sp. SSUT112]MDH2353505.1 hypothetical protein [Bradyrhizobium sp. SSUT112]
MFNSRSITAMHVAQQIPARNTSPRADPIEVFRERAWAVAKLLENHMIADKQTAVDGLWRFAEAHGVVRQIGTDAAQAILSEAFA